MKIGFIGLGRMGGNMVERLLSKNHKIVVYNRSQEKVQQYQKKGAIGSGSIDEMTIKLSSPRTIILMVTAGNPVDMVLDELLPLLKKGDTIIEAGNSYFEDSIRRHSMCRSKGINFLDMGTSGGLEGARNGASLTIGGDQTVFRKLESLFQDLAIQNGYAHVGPVGAGHFVKMVHNGIEYSLLESYAEGYEVLKKGPYNLNLEQVSAVWSNGSVIRSWITQLAQNAFSKDPKLSKFKGIIGGGETGAWTSKVAQSEGVEMQCLAHAIKKRKESIKTQSFSTKFVSAIRNEFGGHVEPK